MGEMADWQIDQMFQPGEADDGIDEYDTSEEIDREDYETLRDRFEARFTRYDGSPRR